MTQKLTLTQEVVKHLTNATAENEMDLLNTTVPIQCPTCCPGVL